MLRLKFRAPVYESAAAKEHLRCGILVEDDFGSRNQCWKCLFRVQSDPLLSCLLWREVNRSVAFRVNFSVWLFNQWKRKTRRPSCSTGYKSEVLANNRCSIVQITERPLMNCSQGYSHYRLHVYTEILPSLYLCMTTDVRWSNMLMCILIHYAQLQYVMAWLSTLGGAYSALGDHSTQSSHKAGEISEQQLVVASRLGNPILAAQCKVYFAMSLIQRGYLKDAVKIIREQFEFAVSRGSNRDEKLISSCKSAWNRIRYIKKQQKDNKKE